MPKFRPLHEPEAGKKIMWSGVTFDYQDQTPVVDVLWRQSSGG